MRWRLVGLVLLALFALLLFARRAQLFAQDFPGAPDSAPVSENGRSSGDAVLSTTPAGAVDSGQPNPGQDTVQVTPPLLGS